MPEREERRRQDRLVSRAILLLMLQVALVVPTVLFVWGISSSECLTFCDSGTYFDALWGYFLLAIALPVLSATGVIVLRARGAWVTLPPLVGLALGWIGASLAYAVATSTAPG